MGGGGRGGTMQSISNKTNQSCRCTVNYHLNLFVYSNLKRTFFSLNIFSIKQISIHFKIIATINTILNHTQWVGLLHTRTHPKQLHTKRLNYPKLLNCRKRPKKRVSFYTKENFKQETAFQ